MTLFTDIHVKLEPKLQFLSTWYAKSVRSYGSDMKKIDKYSENYFVALIHCDSRPTFRTSISCGDFQQFRTTLDL